MLHLLTAGIGTMSGPPMSVKRPLSGANRTSDSGHPGPSLTDCGNPAAQQSPARPRCEFGFPLCRRAKPPWEAHATAASSGKADWRIRVTRVAHQQHCADRSATHPFHKGSAAGMKAGRIIARSVPNSLISLINGMLPNRDVLRAGARFLMAWRFFYASGAQL